jgi:catechol 2,3-dioxygenase-like lactoylglutathione lyase family enzyme
MAEFRKAAAHWIDHVVVPTNNMDAWVNWAVNATGVERAPIRGLTTAEVKRGGTVACFLKIGDGSCHFGAFLQKEQLPASLGLGVDMPRYAFFVRAEELDDHIVRLDRFGVPHTDPVRMTTEGADGTSVIFEDPDGNQFEFWAPDEMPAGAMEIATELGVGRVAIATLGSRDLQRTADFFSAYCDIDPLDGPEIPEDTLVIPMVAGSRYVFHLKDMVDDRVTGHGPWFAMHTALTVAAEEFMPSYVRLWAGVPEEEDRKEKLGLGAEEEDALPARTGIHGSPTGQIWKKVYDRGDEIYDPDGHAFHFIGGISSSADGSLAVYTPKEQATYLEELEEVAK